MADSLTINRKEQIMEAAAKLFREKGFEATSVRDIANMLGIEAASLYHHIKSKDEILEYICMGMAERFISAIKEVNDIYFNAEERLRMAIAAHVNLITGNQDQSAVFLREWRSLREEPLRIFMAQRDQYEKEFRVIIKDGVNEDVFDDVDLKFATLNILSSVNWINEWYKPKGGMDAAEIAKKLSDFIMGGLRKKLVTDANYKQ